MPASSKSDEPAPATAATATATAVRARVLLFEVRRLAIHAPTGGEARRRQAELRLGAELHVVRRRRRRSWSLRERRALARRFLRALGSAAAQEAAADGLAAMMASLTTAAAVPAPPPATPADGLGEMLEKMVVSGTLPDRLVSSPSKIDLLRYARVVQAPRPGGGGRRAGSSSTVACLSVREGKAPSSYLSVLHAIQRPQRQLELHRRGDDRRSRAIALQCLYEPSLSLSEATATATARPRVAALLPSLQGAAMALAPPVAEGGGQFGAPMALVRMSRAPAPAGAGRDRDATAAPLSAAATLAACTSVDECGAQIAALMARLDAFMAQATAGYGLTAVAAPPSAASATPADGLGEMLDKMALSGEE
ncbi:hypothetical protein ACP4OV_017713 [Aristida adscensionis]